MKEAGGSAAAEGSAHFFSYIHINGGVTIFVIHTTVERSTCVS